MTRPTDRFGRPLAVPPRRTTTELPPYPEHFAASSVASQITHRSAQWGSTARALRAAVLATEDALIAALDEQERRAGNRARIREAAGRDTDKGLR